MFKQLTYNSTEGDIIDFLQALALSPFNYHLDDGCECVEDRADITPEIYFTLCVNDIALRMQTRLSWDEVWKVYGAAYKAASVRHSYKHLPQVDSDLVCQLDALGFDVVDATAGNNATGSIYATGVTGKGVQKFEVYQPNPAEGFDKFGVALCDDDLGPAIVFEGSKLAVEGYFRELQGVA